MLFWVLVLLLLATLISPRLRELEKRHLSQTFIGIGIFALLIGVFASVYLSPKITSLQRDLSQPITPLYMSPYAFLYILVIISMLALGFYYRRISNPSNKLFYALFIVFIILLNMAIGFYTLGVIQPVYELTNSIK